MSDERWYFTKEQLENSPSRRCGIDADKELSQRQQAANFIQDMGQRLQVTQLCINTAIVYMHRFYCFHSFTTFHRNAIASAALFLAAKVEEQPRKLEHIIRVAQMCLTKGQPPPPNPDRRSEIYLKEAQELVQNENILLMTLGFDVAIEHPHAFIVKFCHIANASKDLSQTSYFMASNSLHLTTMCLQYKPTVVACFCIHLVCKWSNWQIPKSKENLPWYRYIDPNVTEELLEQLTNEFLVIFDKCPSRLKKKIQNSQLSSQNPSMSSYPFDMDSRKPSTSQHSQPSFSNLNSGFAQQKMIDDQNQPSSSVHNKNILSAGEMKNPSNILPPVNHQSTYHSPATKPVASISSSAVNGTGSTSTSSLSSNNVHDNHMSSKLPLSNSVIPPQGARSGSIHTLPPPLNTSSSSHRPHKSASSSSSSNMNNPHVSASANVAAKIRPVLVPGHNLLSKDPMQRELARKMHEVKQEPGQSHVPPITSAMNNNHHVKSSSSSTHRKDNGLHQESLRSNIFVTAPSSHSEIISNVVKEVAKQNEKQRLCTTVKSEPAQENVKPFIFDAVDAAKTHKGHSIFSPSPIAHNEDMKSSPLDYRTQEIVLQTEPLADVSKMRHRSISSSSGEPELIPIVKKVETVAGYEDIFKKNVVSVPSTVLSPKHELKERKNNVSAIGNSSVIKEESTCSYEYMKQCPANQPTYTEEHALSTKQESSECTGHSHKKKKKHKEKDKRHDKEKHRHKEKKRHKEEKHRKEHKERDVLKDPSPIKITIPRELITPEMLGDIPHARAEKDEPVKLKIKLPKDQLAFSVTDSSAAVATTSAVPECRLKKSRKRNRESVETEMSKKFAYNGPNSHNGY